MGQHVLSVRQCTHISQRLSDDLEVKTTNLQHFIIKMHRHQDYPLCQIGNADQTPLMFEVLHSTTAATEEVRSVSITMTGHKKDRFTVMLACTANGGKLQPYVVFKRKTTRSSTEGKVHRCRFKHQGFQSNKVLGLSLHGPTWAVGPSAHLQI